MSMERMKWCDQCDTWKSHWTRVSKKCKDCVENNRSVNPENRKGGGISSHYKRLHALAEIVKENKESEENVLV